MSLLSHQFDARRAGPYAHQQKYRWKTLAYEGVRFN